MQHKECIADNGDIAVTHSFAIDNVNSCSTCNAQKVRNRDNDNIRVPAAVINRDSHRKDSTGGSKKQVIVGVIVILIETLSQYEHEQQQS